MKAFIRSILLVLSRPVFSRLYGRIMRIRHPRFMAQWLIGIFKNHYGIHMDNYIGEAKDYASLSEFFVRPLDPGKVTLTPREEMILSPADGVLKSLESINNDEVTQVKGVTYKVSDLIRESIDFSRGWYLGVIYLSPSNYHRYHYPITANLEAYHHARGALYPVNAMGMEVIKRLFVKNERVIIRFRKNELPLYAIAVGATFVGSIKMNFIPKIKRDNRWKELGKDIKQLDEMGRFDMGSTIILLVPKDLAEPIPGIIDKPIKVGDPIFALKQ